MEFFDLPITESAEHAEELSHFIAGSHGLILKKLVGLMVNDNFDDEEFALEFSDTKRRFLAKITVKSHLAHRLCYM